MANFDKVILNGTTYTIPSGGGGGATYTAGDGIDITENVITNTREQRVLIDEDDDTGLHSGFIVKSPHWRYSNSDIDFGTWYREFHNNIPVENADPYTQAGYLTNDRMKFTLKELVFDESQTPAWASRTLVSTDYISINGVVVPSGSTISISYTEADFVLKSGDVIIVNSTGFYIISALISEELSAQYLSYSSIVNIDNYAWINVNSAYVVHSGQESQLADSTSISTVVGNAVGNLYAGSSGTGTNTGKFTRNKRFLFPDSTVGTSTTGSGTNQVDVITVRDILSNSTKNLTMNYDQTYNEQQTVTYYAYDGGIEALDFFGSSVYGGSWYGSQHTYVEKLNNEYYIDIPLDNLTANLTYPNCLRLYADTMDGQKEMYLTINNNKLIAGSSNGYGFNDEMSGQYIQLNEMMTFVVNGQKITVGSSEWSKVLINDISNLTSLGIMPTSTGNGYISNGFMCYLQGSSQPASASYRQLTLWAYEDTGTVTVQYQNHPEKLNHYIRYAGETGTAVGNRKAYILTDKNISQSDYIQALETRIGNKQDALVSGTNIKTINNQSILGEGNITIEGGSGGGGISGITMNGSPVTVTSGVADLGTVITEHQSLANYYTKSEIDAMIGNISSSLDTINGEVI